MMAPCLCSLKRNNNLDLETGSAIIVTAQAMIVVGGHRLVALMDKHPEVRPWIEAWEKEVRKANWAGPQDIKNRYQPASLLADNVVIFNVKGNSFRLQVQVAYQCGVVTIERCGTHAEYDRWK